MGTSAEHAAAVTLQIGFFHQGIVLMRYQVGLDLRHEVHDHHDHDQQRGPAEIERNIGRDLQKLRKQMKQLGWKFLHHT